MFLLFLLLWIILNGQFTLEILAIGIAVSVAMYAFICKFMDYSIEKDKHLLRKLPLTACYLFLLIKEIIKANVDTIHMVLSSKEEIDPVIVKFSPPLKTRAAKVMLANSITLTPGTITVSVEGDEFMVHALDAEFAAGLYESPFIALLQKMEAIDLQKKKG